LNSAVQTEAPQVFSKSGPQTWTEADDSQFGLFLFCSPCTFAIALLPGTTTAQSDVPAVHSFEVSSPKVTAKFTGQLAERSVTTSQ
jgi:hypothetical protein